jgi:hypothetical protein
VIRTLFLVQRAAFDAYGRACEDQHGNDTGSRVPLRGFADRAAAEAYCRELTAQARRTMNPFHLLDAYAPDELRGRLAGLGLPLPSPEESWHEEWREWWDLCQDEVTDEQRAEVWAVCSSRPLYEVVELELR